MLKLYCMFALGLPLLGGPLHPALAPTAQQLEQVWQVGYERAARDKDMKGVLKLAERGIGSINNKTVSWLTFEHPRLAAYREGFNARKQYWTEEAMKVSRGRLAESAGGGLHRLRFHAEIGLHPAIRGNHIARQANPDDLKDVHVVLKVGERTYQPVAQPGDVEPVAQEGHYRRDETVTRKTRKKDRDGKYRDEEVKTTISVEDRYTWYKGEFDIAFDLYDKEEMPRITDHDQEFTVIVILRIGERRATYLLDEWRAAYEKP